MTAARLIAGGLAGTVLLLSACTGSSARGAQAPPRCSWPTSVNGAAIVLQIADADTVDAIDPTDGRRLGFCRGAGISITRDELKIDGQSTQANLSPWLQPPVAGDLDSVPDNAISTNDNVGPAVVHGGVRTLRTGVRHQLSFGGWVVVTSIGTRLLLSRFNNPQRADGHMSVRPADWCLLPSVAAALADCVRIPGSTGSGQPTVTPDGSVRWIASTPAPITIGARHGVAATDGAVVAALVIQSVAVPIGYDGHTVVITPGSFGDSAQPLAWAHVTQGSTGLVVRTHQTTIVDRNDGSNDDVLGNYANVIGSADGSRLAISSGLRPAVLLVTAPAKIQTVTLPWLANTARVVVLSWPFDNAAG